MVGEGIGGYGKRVRATLIEESTLLFYPKAIDLSDNKATSDRNRIETYIRQGHESGDPVEVIVYDTLQANRGLLDENKADDIGRLFNWFKYLGAEYSVKTLLIHHTGKGETTGPRGSYVIMTDATNVWTTKAYTNRSGEYHIELHTEKIRDSEPFSLLIDLEQDEEHNSLRVVSYSNLEIDNLPTIHTL